MTEKKSHHLWRAEMDEKGLAVRRSKTEELDEEEEAKEVTAALWGLWGASLVDDQTLSSEIPQSIVARFNEVGNRSVKQARPELPAWKKLRRAYGSGKIDEIRKSIALGIRIRQASKELDVPFLMASEIVSDFQNVDKRVVKALVNELKSGNKDKAAKFGKVGRKLSSLYDEFSRQPRKIAVDEKAKNYWQSYYGAYGEDLVEDIKRRVRADLAEKWLRKNGVDDAAARYWSNYFKDGYGEALVSVVPKSLSPVKD